MIFGFQHFHPLKGSPPNDVHWFGGDIVFRARALLHERNLKQIKVALGIVNWLIAHSPAKEMVWKELAQQAIMVDEYAITSSKNRESELEAHLESQKIKLDLDSDVTALRLCVDRFDLSEYPNIPDLRWSELFAVLALALVDKAKDDEEFYGRSGEDNTGYFYAYRISTHVSFWLMFAMDSVSIAEGLYRCEAISQDIEAQVKNRISLKSKRAGILRHEKTDRAALAIFDFYRGGSFKSLRDCGVRFIERHPKLVEHLAETNRLRTLVERLSQQLQQQRNQ